MRLSLARGLVAAALSAALAATLAAATPSGAAEPDTGLALTYQPVVAADGSFRAIDVTLRFRGAASGVTIIDLPNEWGGFDKLYTYLDDMRAENAMLAPSADPAKIALRHAPGAPIVLRYRLRGADRAEQLQDGEVVNDYRPLIQPTWFHLIGDAVVARPEHLDGDTPASFSVRGMPAGTRFASDLEHPGLTVDGLIESIAVGGDFRLIDTGHGARLAVRGSFATRDDAGWTQSFRRVAAAMSDYWGNDAGRYLVTIIPFAPPGPGATSIGGTGRGDAFAFFATTNALPEMLDRLMAHEMAHSWVNVRIGGFSEKVPEAEQFWLSEGFTDFTSWRALVRAGVWTPEQYFAQFNDALREYDTSPLRAAPHKEAAGLFWTDEKAQRLAYLRGMLFAHWADDRLRRAPGGSSMRDLLLAMQAAAPAARSDAVTLFGAEAQRRDAAIGEGIARFIDRGEPIALPADMLAACGTLRQFERPVFDRSFDVDATLANGRIIAGVARGGPAWQAGMRDGMTLIGRSGGEIGNSQREIAYDVDDGGTKRTLRYMPQGRGRETVREFALGDLSPPAARRACVAALSR